MQAYDSSGDGIVIDYHAFSCFLTPSKADLSSWTKSIWMCKVIEADSVFVDYGGGSHWIPRSYIVRSMYTDPRLIKFKFIFRLECQKYLARPAQNWNRKRLVRVGCLLVFLLGSFGCLLRSLTNWKRKRLIRVCNIFPCRRWKVEMHLLCLWAAEEGLNHWMNSVGWIVFNLLSSSTLFVYMRLIIQYPKL